MKKILTMPLIIMFFVFLIITIITFIVALNYIYLDLYTSLTLSISVISLFATFGGAYLGAKVSGEYATDMMKKQLFINELMNNSKDNLEFLKEFNKLHSKHTNIKQHYNQTKLEEIISLRTYSKVYTDLKKLDRLSISTSTIIRLQYDNYLVNFERYINEYQDLKYKLQKSYAQCLKSKLEYKNIQNYEIGGLEFFINLIEAYHLFPTKKIKLNYSLYEKINELTFESNTTAVVNDKYESNNFGDIVEFVLKQNEDEIENCILYLNELKSVYNNIKFKNANDFNKYITDNMLID